MKIVNSEISLPKTSNLNSAYIEEYLDKMGLIFIRWAIVAVEETNYKVNVSHCVDV